MMRLASTVLGVLAVFGVLAVGARAADKEVTLTGKILCAKCALKEAKKCQTAIQAKEGDKTVTYYFLDKGNKEEYHEPVCGGGSKEGTVTGVVSEKDGKKYITPKKVEYAKGAVAAPQEGRDCCAAAARKAPVARGCCARRCCCN
jgi:hypothetical protein